MRTTPHELQATLLLDAKATLGEGSLWHPREQRLYWLDIEGKQLHIFNPADGSARSFSVPARIGTVVPAEAGGALVALQSGIYHIDTHDGSLRLLEPAPFDKEKLRFNDGKCDPAGRFWVGSMALNEAEGAGSLYRFDRAGKLEEMISDVTISNGIIWSPDERTMYYIDTPTGKVQAFDYDKATGAIGKGRTVVTVPDDLGHPDGMTIDADGKLWIALWGGAAVGRWDPDNGALLQTISVPAPHTTSCAFGGPDLDTLYITTAWEGLSEEQRREFPFSGGLFVAEPGVKGIKAGFYKGEIT